jgi:type IV pilus assembly protein PilW
MLMSSSSTSGSAVRHMAAVRARSGQAGYSLVELMIAITIGLLMLAGLASVFVGNLRTNAELENANQQIENGRYAMQILTDELHNAGQFAAFDPGLLPVPTSKPDPCATDLPSLRAALPLAVQGNDNATTVPTCLSDVASGTDILVVRRVSTCAVGDANCDAAETGAPYFQASACTNATELSSTDPHNYFALDTTVSKLALHARDCTTLAPLYRYRTHIYFIANNDKPGDNIPTLKRAELGAGSPAIVPLVEGIQNLQIEYGIDSVDSAVPTTGIPVAYTADPDSYASCTGAACVANWHNVVAAKITVLARNMTLSTGFSDAKVYSLGRDANGNAKTGGPFNDGYRRHVYQQVVRINNVAGRNSQ